MSKQEGTSYPEEREYLCWTDEGVVGLTAHAVNVSATNMLQAAETYASSALQGGKHALWVQSKDSPLIFQMTVIVRQTVVYQATTIEALPYGQT